MRALKTELETLASQPRAADGTPAASVSAPLSALTPPAPLPLARALENAIASVVGGPSRLVLALSEDGGELDASFAAACETTRRRALHVRLAPAPSAGARSHQALLDALRERTNGRPGVATILDPLIKSAASFVLQGDLWSLESFLTPEALDEVPAVASRVLLTRFVPALAAQLPDVPRELLAALLAERTGSDDFSLAAIAGALPAADLVRAVARVAARAGAAVVFSCSSATDFAASTALDASSSLEGAPTSVLWALGSRRDAWEVQRSLLDEDERRRVERALAPPAPVAATEAQPGATAAAPITPQAGAAAATDDTRGEPTLGANLAPRARAAARRASDAAPRTGADATADAATANTAGGAPRLQGADETPPLAIPRPLKLKAGFAERLKKSVLAKNAQRKAAAARPPKRSTATDAGSPRRGAGRRTISGVFTSAWAPRPIGEAQPTGLKRVVVVALPFVFLASLGIFARREADFRATQRGPTPEWVLKLAASRGKPTPAPAPAKTAAPAPAKTAAPAPAKPAGSSPTTVKDPKVVAQSPAPAKPAGTTVQVPVAQVPTPVQTSRRGGLRVGEHAAPTAGPTAAKDGPQRAAAPGTTVQDRLIAAERMPQGNEQLAAFVQIYDTKLDNDADTNLQKRGVLLRLAAYRSEPEALDRIIKALDATSPRDLRLTAIQSLSIGNTPLAPGARTRLQTLVNEDSDEAIKSAAQIALAAQPR